MRRLLVSNGDDAPDWLDKEPDENLPLSRSKKIALDITLVISVPFCFWAGWFELERALEGRWQAWVYAFEWPLFGILAIWLWRRIRFGAPIKFPKLEPPNFDEKEGS